MRIALTHPWCWPAVTRGGERLFADLGRYLAEAGHDVVAISAAPDASSSTEGGIRRWTGKARGAGLPRWTDLDQAVTYLPYAARALRRAEPDVIHGMYHLDGVAARLARRRPYVLHIQGMPRRASLAHRPVHRRLFPVSARSASAVIAVSHAAAAALAEEFGIDARVIHNGVFVEEFAAGGAGVRQGDRPEIVFPAAGADPRKRLWVLVEAVKQLRSSWPELILSVAERPDPATARRLQAELGGAVDIRAVAGPTSMGAVYARAWVTCLPAVEEAFGLVLVESLAAGRPAVGVRSGGVAEVVSAPEWLGAPDDPGSLAEALDHALGASQAPGVVERCRAMAQPFDWSARGPEFERLYREVIAGR